MDILKSSAFTLDIGPLVLVDGVTRATGLAYSDVTVKLRKAGGAGSSKSMTSLNWVEDADGHYIFTGTASDSDTFGQLTIDISASGILPYSEEHQIVEEVRDGQDIVTFTLNLSGSPVAGASVWVTKDEEGLIQTNPVKITDENGQARFILTNGHTYYAHALKDNTAVLDAFEFIAEADS